MLIIYFIAERERKTDNEKERKRQTWSEREKKKKKRTDRERGKERLAMKERERMGKVKKSLRMFTFHQKFSLHSSQFQ